MKTRTDLLNHLAEKYNLNRYLEIGVQIPALNFDKVNCRDKVGVDPDPGAKADFVLTSDQFFETVFQYSGTNYGSVGISVANEFEKHFPSNEKIKEGVVSFGIKFDLIFIDGLHTAEQVKKDFENAMKVLSLGGFIVIHDCNPLKEEHTIVPRPTERGHWNGDVYKFVSSFPGYSSLIRFTVDVDNGCMVYQKRLPHNVHFSQSPIDWQLFDRHRKALLNLVSWEEFENMNLDPPVIHN